MLSSDEVLQREVLDNTSDDYAVTAGSDLTTMMKPQTQRPKVVAHVSSATRGALLVEPQAFAEFKQQANLNINASCHQELYSAGFENSSKVLNLPCNMDKRVSVLRKAFAYAYERQNRSKSGSILRRTHSSVDTPPL